MIFVVNVPAHVRVPVGALPLVASFLVEKSLYLSMFTINV